LARDLGLKSSAEPVEKIVDVCRRKVQKLIEDFDGPNTPAEILPWLAGKLSTCFIEINEDSDLDRIIAEYGKKKEYAFATLEQELSGCTEGAEAGALPALRAVKVAENAAARDRGLRMIVNFRVPENSILFRTFYGRTFASEAFENLNWWKASSGTRLENHPVKVEVKCFGDSVQALITPIRLH
jgi:hypothetical protein